MEKRFDKTNFNQYNTDMETHKDDLIASASATEENHCKKEALRLLDQRIAQKIAEKAALSCEDLDDTLSQISNERKQQRESLRSRQSEKENTEKVAAAVKEKKADDMRLDALIDRMVSRVSRLATLQPKFSSVGKLQNLKETIIRIESSLSDRAALAVERTDVAVDFAAEAVTRLGRKTERKWRYFRHWAERHKRQLLAGFTGTVVLAASAAILIGNMTAFEYMYNGKVLGIVKDQRDVYMTVEVIGDKLTHVYGAEINIDPVKDIAFRKVIGWNLPIDDKDKVLNTLTYLRDMNAKAYALLIDGKKVAILDSVTDAESILNTVKSKYTSDSESIQYTSIGFAENVKIEEVSTKIGNIDNEEAALEFILTGAVEKKIHKVASGETFNVIANHYGLTPAELQEANRGTSPDRLQIGQELVLNQIVPLVTVQTTEVAKYMTAIQYDITFEETSTLYKGEQTIKSSGKSGQKEVVAEIVRENGTEVKREELSAVVVSAPVSQVVLKGTKELPPLIGTGTFIYPTRGTLSSRFGTRWGRMHYGIDIAAPYGTKIRASDGGKVIFAGWDGALGYVVRIDHGQNKVTVYGHCSKLMVKAGDKVYQDQHIANVGSTGRSTGPHVHFEVRINGVAKNPLNYLK
jgi:murein DD-endopeptidase MepM/ murein hydrolase activator NlpD